jgi:hypothetical protein
MKSQALKFAVCLFLFYASGLSAQQTKKELPPTPSFNVRKATSEIKIDGALDEPAWSTASVIPIAFEWQPGDNVPPPVKTDCFITFDDRYLYIGIRAYDPEPRKIRAHLMDRDSIDTFVQDDHVGVMIDSFNDERRAIQLRMNPLGVQADAIFSDLEGIEDWSWDLIWNSRGRITEQGYEVEVAIPFNQIRFPRTANIQTWGIEFFRSYPRNIRYRMSSRPTDRDKSCILCQENRITGFESMTPGRNLEFDPTVTANHTDDRPNFPEGDLEQADQNVDGGLTARWGITPNLIFNGTINPDFSQVEADVAQLDVNTRFALFFPEKRPFFLEGSDMFTAPIQNIIFTRTVVDPNWGIKMTGKEGKNGLGVFLTRDDVNSLIIPSNQTSQFAFLDEQVTGTVLRYRRDVFSNSTLGALFSDREGSGYHNRFFGADGFFRLSNSDTIDFQALHSDTQYPTSLAEEFGQAFDPFGDEAVFVRYNHLAQSWLWGGLYEDFGEGFRSDSGFIPRVDTRRINGFLQRRFFGDGSQWYTQLNFGFIGERIENHDGLLTDSKLQGFANYSGPLQSFLEVDVYRNKEFFDGVTYDINRVETIFQMKPTGKIAINFFGQVGDTIDFSNSQAADSVLLNPKIEYRVNRPINLQFDHTYQRLNVGGGTLFTANLSQFRVVYQFNVRMFVRAIIQYLNLTQNQSLYTFPVDAETRTLFTQFLFSYKLNPQTVVFVGYSDNRLGLQGIDLLQTDRTFFMKVGYAFLF